jgi:uncharacterized protein YqhQ
MSDKDHFYGGQAIIEGVMMRGPDAWAAAVRRADGTVAVTRQPISDFTQRHKWLRWPLIRGNVALVEALTLGMRSLIYSFNVLVEEEEEKKVAEDDGKSKKRETSGWLVWLSLIPALVLGVGLFVLLPASVPDWLRVEQMSDLGKNLLEAVARIVAIIGYILVISLMPDIRRVFQHHGAEHATINCLEAGETVTVENCRKYAQFHPRCGSSFLLLFVVVKLLLNAPLGWPEWWLRLPLRLAMILPAAAVAYEILRIGGKHRDRLFGRLLSAPGKYLQRLTTRVPDERQLETAIYALAALTDDVELPDGLPPPQYTGMDGKLRDAQTEPVALEEETV